MSIIAHIKLSFMEVLRSSSLPGKAATGTPIDGLIVQMALSFQKQANLSWYEIFSIVIIMNKSSLII